MWTNFTFNQFRVVRDYNLNLILQLPSYIIYIFIFSFMNTGLLSVGHASDKIDLIIIDSGLGFSEFDYLSPQVKQYKVVWVDYSTDLKGLFDNIIDCKKQYSSIHIISHGSPGIVMFGERCISLNEIEKILQNKNSFPVTDVYFYGCDIAAGEGRESMRKLGELSPGLSFHASVDKTGKGEGGSNEILEYSTSGVISSAKYLYGYSGGNLQCEVDYFAGCDYTVNRISPPGILGLLLEGTNFGNLTDTDLNNFVTVNTAASIAGATIASGKRVSGSFPAGKRAGFLIEPLGPGLLTVNVLEGLQIKTYLDGQFQESATLQSGGLLGLSLLGGSTAGKRRIDFVTSESFDEIELVMTTALSALNSIRIYYGFAEDEECDGNGAVAVIPENGFSPSIVSSRTGIIGVCIGCSVTGTANVINNNLNDFGSINLALGLGPSGSISVNTGQVNPAGSEAGFLIGSSNILGILDLGVLENIRIRTYLGGAIRNDFWLNNSGVKVGLLPGADKLAVSIPTTLTYDEIRITVSAGLAVLASTFVYNAFIRFDDDSDGFPNTIDQCPEGNDALLNRQGQPLACELDCNVFAGYDRNVSSSQAGTVQLTAALPGQGWQGLPGNPSPAGVGIDGTVFGMSEEGVYRFELTDGFCSDTVTVNYVTGFGEPGCDRPMVGSNIILGNSTFSGICLNCNAGDAENVINGNLSDYSTYSSLLSVGVFTTVISIADTANVYDGGIRAGFVLEFEDALLNLDLIGSFRLTTYLDGVQQESVVYASGLAGTNAVGLGGGRFRISFQTSSDFNEVSLEFANLLGLSLGNRLRIYNAFTEPASCRNGVDPLNNLSEACIEPLTSCAPYNPSIEYTRTGISGVACGLCGLDDLSNILDADPTTYATLSLSAGLLITGSVSVRTEYPYESGFEVGFAINATPDLLSLDVLGDVTINTYQNGILRETRNGGTGFLNVSLVSGSTSISFVGFTASQSFDEVQMVINSPASVNLFSQLQIYFAYVRMDSDGDGIPDCQDKCLAGDDSIDLNGSGIPDACELTLVAADDTAGPINGNQGGTGVVNVLDNDTIENGPVDLDVVALSRIGGDAALVLNVNGMVDILPGIPAGTYTLMYRICEIASPTNCDEATATIVVAGAEISALDDFAGYVDGESGATGVLNVLQNDLFDGQEATIDKVELTAVYADAPLTLNTDGTVDVVSGTPSGLYIIEYQICDRLNPDNCSFAIARINVLGNEEPCEVTYMAGCGYLVNRVNSNTFISLLLGGTNYNNLVDTDLNNYVEVNTILAVGGSSLGSVKKINGAFQGGIRVGYVIEAVGGGLADVDLLEGVTLVTYLDGAVQETAEIGSGGLLNLSLIGGSQLSKRRIDFVTSTDFDEVELVLSNTLTGLSSVRLYYAFVETESCDADCKTAINIVNFPGATAETCSTTLCPSFFNVGNVVSPDTMASALRTSLLAEIAYVQVNSNTVFPVGTEFGFVVSRDGLLGILGLDVLNNITVTTRNGNSVVETFNAGANLAGISLLDNNLTVISFKSTNAFENLRISYSVLLSLLGTNRVHYAFIRSDTDGDGIPDCIDSCPGGDDTVLNKFGMPLACNPDCTVFAGFDQVVSSSLPGNANLLPAGSGQFWSADPSNPSPVSVNQNGEVSGMNALGLYRFILTDGECSDTVFVNYNSGALSFECNNPIVGPGTVIGSSSFSGICILCGSGGAENVISGNLNSFLEYSSLLSLITNTTLVSVADEEQTYQGGTRVGFVMEITDAAINADLISGFSLTTFLNGVQRENISTSNGLLAVSAAELGGGKFRLSFDTSLEFDEVAVNFANVISLSLGNQIRIYYAFTEPVSCPNNVDPGINPEDICIEFFSSCNGLNPRINYERTGIDGVACVSCEITDLSHLVDGNPSTFARMNLGAGIVVQGSVSTEVDQQLEAGFEAGYVIGSAPELLSLDILNGLTIATYLNGIFQESGTNVSGLLNVVALAGTTDLGLISINTTLPFNEIRLIVTAPVSVNLLSDLHIYYPYIRRDTDGDGIPDCLDKCFEGDDGFDSNGNGIPDACELIIIANDDNLGPVFGRIGGEIGNVLENDFLGGEIVTGSEVDITIVEFGGITEALISSQGDLTLPEDVPPGRYVLSYSICEMAVAANCSQAAINIEVSATLPDINVTTINVEVTGQVNTNDRVPDGTYYAVPLPDPDNPVDGILDLFSDGSYTFISPNPGVYVYTINVCLPGTLPDECIREMLVITVTNQYAENNPPVANADIGFLLKNGQVTLRSLENDAPGHPSRSLVAGSVVIVEMPVTGQASVDAFTGDITYIPDTDYTGSDTLRYRVCDNSAVPLCAEAMQVFIILDPEAPNTTFAYDDFAVTFANESVGGNVLINDVDPEGGNQTVTVQNLVVGGVGTLTIDEEGFFNFEPASGISGSYSFPYQVCDDGSPEACARATLYILILTTIEANDDMAGPLNGNSGMTGLLNILDNDLLNNQDVTAVDIMLEEIIPDPDMALTLNPDGSVDLAPQTPGGTYSFTYRICETNNPSNCDTALVSVTVLATPDYTPTNDIDNLEFVSGGTFRDFVVNVFEIENGDQIAGTEIRVRISKLSAYSITYSLTNGVSDVLGGMPNNNGDWNFEENTNFIIATLKPGVNINSMENSIIGFTITRRTGIPGNTQQNLTTTILFDSGGEINNSNNIVQTTITAN